MLALALSVVVAAGSADELRLTRAVFADGRLWVRSESGRLMSLAEGEKTKRDELEGVLDVCVWGGHPVVLTRSGLRVSSGAAWSRLVELEVTEGVLGCGADVIYVHAVDRLIVWRAGKPPSTVKLSEPLGGVIETVLPIGGRVLIGLDRGEWGGGLHSVDASSGASKTIEKKTTGDICAKPFDAACDPVNGLAVSPWRPECVVVAVGLVHMMSHGSLLQVCGDEVSVLAERSMGAHDSVSFFGVVAVRDALWAAGVDGLYRVDEKGKMSKTALPRFVEVGGVSVSFAVPGLVLVLTDVNRHVSVSGAVPLLVAR